MVSSVCFNLTCEIKLFLILDEKEGEFISIACKHEDSDCILFYLVDSDLHFLTKDREGVDLAGMTFFCLNLKFSQTFFSFFSLKCNLM